MPYQPRGLMFEQFNVGDSYVCQGRTVTEADVVHFAGISGDYNPLHTEEIFTTKVAGYPTVFAHGMLTMGMNGRMLTNYVGDGRLTKYGVRFTNQVWPGDTLNSTATVEEVAGGIVKLKVETTNQDGLMVLSGYAEARVD